VRIYVVDDSKMVRARLVAMLRGLPHIEIAGEAETVAEALVGVGRLQADLIILDLQFPDGDGVTVLETAKRNPTPPCVAILTNHADEFHRARCASAGADFFLDKSKQFDRIPAILRALHEARAPRDD
jgi:two-component system, NarL family, response regulator DevR